MTNRAQFFRIAALVTAATIGEGVFALPYIIQASGWVLTLFYFIALTAFVSVAHVVYLRTVAAVDEKERLLGLAKKYFGGTGFWIGFIAIVVGLLFGFIAYLSLGTKFLGILFPALPSSAALFIFWLFIACLIWGSEGKIAFLEVIGVLLVACAIFFVFGTGNPVAAFANMPAVVPHNFFLPFGAILFALAGWTSVEQVYELLRNEDGRAPALHETKRVFWAFVTGSSFAALLYCLFGLGVIGSGGAVATNTISGIGAWPGWRKDILALVGIVSVFVVSLPIAREIRGAMEKDLRWNSFLSRAFIILAPIAILLAGFNNFLEIVSLGGGVFLAAQYLLIISVGRRTLALSRREKIMLDIVAILFVCAAVYETIVFVV